MNPTMSIDDDEEDGEVDRIAICFVVENKNEDKINPIVQLDE